MTSTSLSSLLAQANNLNNGDHDPELPQIRFGIDEIERMSEVVAGRGKRVKGGKGEGHALLSNLGINTSKLSHNISQLPSSSTAPDQSTPRRRRRVQPQGGSSKLEPLGDLGPGYAIGDGDVGAWGRNWHEMVILGGIEVQRQRTIKSFESQFQQRILSNWESEKARILQEELGVGEEEVMRLSTGGSGLGNSTRRFPMAQSSTSKASAESREGGLVMHNKMIKYEMVVSELNRRRLRRDPFEICAALEQSVKGDSKYPPLPTAYNLLSHLVHEPSTASSSSSTSSGSGNGVGIRSYSKAYNDNGKAGRELRVKLAQGGRRFLERDFEAHIDETIAKHPKEAQLGGIPGITNKVRAFVDVTMRNREAVEGFKPETVDGIYLYAQVYYLLRAGYPTESLALLTTHQSSLKRDDYTLPGAFKSYLTSLTTPEPKLPKQLKDQLSNDFNAHIRHNTGVDQFKYALYKLVGRLELGKKNVKVAGSSEDWIWFQLGLVRESSATSVGSGEGDGYDLADLGRQLNKFGNDKFDSGGSKPFTWFNLLLFTGQFEQAVAYLYTKSGLKTDAVHFAVALQYYGLLRIPAKVDQTDLLSFQEIGGQEFPFLNFPRLIKQYIKPFTIQEPATALQYAYLIALGSDIPSGGEKQKEVCLELVRDIVLASRSWSKLLGSVKADGSKETGLIEKDLKLLNLNDEEDYLRQIVLKAAEQANSDASLTDTIELYHLSSSYNKVIETLNKALGHSLSSSPSSTQKFASPSGVGLGLSGAFGGSDTLRGLAEKVKGVYERDFSERTRIDKTNWEILEILLALQKGMNEFESDRPDLALETFKSTNLLPLDADPTSIPRHINNFKDLLDTPSFQSQNLDIIIITTMKCLHRLSQELKKSPYGDHSRLALIGGYKLQAQCLVQFASGLRLRLGPDVYRQLSSMSAFF